MDIEIDSDRPTMRTFTLSFIFAFVLAFGALGEWVTPSDGSIITWSSWQADLARMEAEEELEQYQLDFERLERAFTEEADPIAIQLLTAEILRNCELETVYFPTHQQQLIQATESVQNWALRILEKEEVTEVLLDTEEFLFSE